MYACACACVCVCVYVSVCARECVSLVPRLLGGGEPGTHYLRMRLITPTFQVSGYFLCTSVYGNVMDERAMLAPQIVHVATK